MHASDVSSKTKLPKLDLPVFKGDVTEWIAFWDLYVVSVHTNPSLSPIEKFTYLRTLVSHTAKDAIAGLALSAINYDEAIDITTSFRQQRKNNCQTHGGVAQFG